VGSHLVESLLEKGARVRCLVRTDPKWLDGLSIDTVRGTLHDPDALAAGVAGAHAIFHMAGRTRAPERSAFIHDNVDGTDNLMMAAEADGHVERIVVASSLAAVGKGGSGVVDESVALKPVSDYGYSKALMEERLQEWSSRLPVTIVRPPAVYGPRETDILTFFKSVARGLCPIVGNGAEPSLSLVHARDLVNGILLAADRSAAIGQTYFLGGPDQVAWHEVRDAAASALSRRVFTLPLPRSIIPLVGAVSEWGGQLTGTYPPLNREKAREILEAALMCSSRKARQEIGYLPSTDLETGVAETLSWYRERNWL
jgi:nucleoside-diphosphate-sugar epimerase